MIHQNISRSFWRNAWHNNRRGGRWKLKRRRISTKSSRSFLYGLSNSHNTLHGRFCLFLHIARNCSHWSIVAAMCWQWRLMQRVRPDVQDILCVCGLLEKAASAWALVENYISPSYILQHFDKWALRIRQLCSKLCLYYRYSLIIKPFLSQAVVIKPFLIFSPVKFAILGYYFAA